MRQIPFRLSQATTKPRIPASLKLFAKPIISSCDQPRGESRSPQPSRSELRWSRPRKSGAREKKDQSGRIISNMFSGLISK
jgi:hypothetical protein